MSRLKLSFLTATVLASVAGIAAAQTPAAAPKSSTYDPAQLPETKGKLAQFTLTPRGDVDGFLLADGTEVHLPPHLSTQLVYAVKPGDAVTIHGLKARNVAMIAGVSVTNDASNVTVTGMGGRRGDRGTEMDVQGKVKEVLHDPRGEVNGALLDNGAPGFGTIVRLPPPEAKRLEALLTVGAPLFVHGEGLDSPLGKVVMARQIGTDAKTLTTIAAPRPPHGPMAWMHGHGPGMHHDDAGHGAPAPR